VTLTFSEVSTQIPLSSEPLALLRVMSPFLEDTGKIP
jgi:hypothetical protein